MPSVWILEVTHGRVVGRLPVDARTHQPYGLLHGGASVVLAETWARWAVIYHVPRGKGAVGIEVNANHLRVQSGWVTGTAPASPRRRTAFTGISTSRTKRAGRLHEPLTVMLVPNPTSRGQTSVHSAMAEGPLVLFHRSGTGVLERLVPRSGGLVRFRMHPGRRRPPCRPRRRRRPRIIGAHREDGWPRLETRGHHVEGTT